MKRLIVLLVLLAPSVGSAQIYNGCLLNAINASQRTRFSQYGAVAGFGPGCLVVQQDTGNVYEWGGNSYTLVGPVTVGGLIPLASGGTSASLTALNGGLVYSTSSALAITSAGTAGQTVVSGGAGAPTFGFSSGNTGTGNLFLGSVTPTSRTSGTDDVFIGPNTYALTSGADDTFIGFQAGQSLTTGAQSTYLGSGAGKAQINGTENTFIGYNAGSAATGGQGNIFIGGSAGGLGTASDTFNVGIGHNSMLHITGGETNVGVGYNTLGLLTSGFNNVGVGLNACQTVTTQNNNTCVGANSNVGANTYTNTTSLGNGAVAGASNVVTIGNSSVNVGLAGVTVPTARLHLPAVTTAAGTSSLKIPAGTVMTTPEQGAIESDGTHLYWTDGTTTRIDLASSGGAGANTALSNLASVNLNTALQTIDVTTDTPTGAVTVRTGNISFTNTDVKTGDLTLKSGDILNTIVGDANGSSGQVILESGDVHDNNGTGPGKVIIRSGRALDSGLRQGQLQLNSNNIVMTTTDGGATGFITEDAERFNIGGHLAFITSVVTPTVDAHAGTGATCTTPVNATDGAGIINLTTTAIAPSSGSQCSIAFNNPYTSNPVCTVTPTSGQGSLLLVTEGIYFTATTTALVVNFTNADATGHTYNWAYHCIQAP